MSVLQTNKVEPQSGTDLELDADVGVKTNSPATELDCVGRIRSTATGTIPASGVGLEAGYDTVTGFGFLFAYDRGATANKPLRLGNDIFNIDQANGRIGVHTTAPNAMFEIRHGTNPLIRITNNTSTNYWEMRVPTAGGVTDGLSFDYLGSAKVFIDTAGRVGINQTSPTELLEVADTTNPTIEIQNTTTGNRWGMRVPTSGIPTDSMQFLYNGSAKLHIGLNGRLGVAGVTVPDAELDVNGAIAINDGVTAPTAVSGKAFIYVDTADGDLKVRFGDGHTATLAADS